ncbi:MAG: hypothetical protein HKM93_02150, partial [Desulfobacteraceae bacterium]|nr:hypothetical protein [Desulfobacteraceae bacterium]
MRIGIMHKIKTGYVSMGILIVFCLTAAASTTCPPDKTDYLAYPSFLTSRVEPNVLLILDNSGSMNE